MFRGRPSASRASSFRSSPAATLDPAARGSWATMTGKPCFSDMQGTSHSDGDRRVTTRSALGRGRLRKTAARSTSTTSDARSSTRREGEDNGPLRNGRRLRLTAETELDHARPAGSGAPRSSSPRTNQRPKKPRSRDQGVMPEFRRSEMKCSGRCQLRYESRFRTAPDVFATVGF